MNHLIRRYLFTTALLVLGVQTSFAQTVAPAPNPVASQLNPAGSPDWHTSVHGPAGFDTLEDRNGPALIGNPLLDGPNPNNLGWFGSVDLVLISPHVSNGLRDTVTAGPRSDLVSLPSANLDWTVSPRFEIGYRFGQASGELVLAYRFLSSAGSATTPGFDALGNAGALHSRLDMIVIDLDYASQENSLLPWAEMKWRVGVRFANLFFDSRETSFALEERTTNHFTGAGPHVALDLWRPVAQSRLALFCKLDAASVLGTTTQSFTETVGGGPLLSGNSERSQFNPAFTMSVQAGLSWTPTDCWRITLGYVYEHWWEIGFAGAITQPPTFSHAEIFTQGIFLRGEWTY